MKNLLRLSRVAMIILFSFSAWAEKPKILIAPDGNIYDYGVYKGKKDIVISDSTGKLIRPLGITIKDDDCFVEQLAIDSSGTKIALSGGCKFPKDNDIGKNREGHYLLTIVDIVTRTTIANIKHANSFCFSPKGDAIVFVNDYPGSSGGEGTPPPNIEYGIFTYNLNSRIKTEISSPVGACDFNWSPHDGRIYFTDGEQHVYRYDASKGRGSLVPYKGIYFSPDKQYNISDVCGDRDDPDAYPHIYRISDHKRMTGWTNLLLKKSGQWPPPQYNRPALSFEFFCNQANAAVFSAKNEQNFIFDLNKGTVIGQFNGRILGTNADGSKVLISPVKSDQSQEPDQPRQIDFSKVEILNLLDIVKK